MAAALPQTGELIEQKLRASLTDDVKRETMSATKQIYLESQLPASPSTPNPFYANIIVDMVAAAHYPEVHGNRIEIVNEANVPQTFNNEVIVAKRGPHKYQLVSDMHYDREGVFDGVDMVLAYQPSHRLAEFTNKAAVYTPKLHVFVDVYGRVTIHEQD